jgi:5-methylcytosine-specific restriction endonuclease McrA
MRYDEDPTYGIEILNYYKDKYIHGSNNKRFPVPAVAKTIKYFNLYNRRINFSRHNLFIRDKFTCQYCGQKYSNTQLTYDHIIPKSRYPDNRKLSTNWHNIVTACRSCNNKKGNKTPKEAGMTLLQSPSEPKYSIEYLPWYKELFSIYKMPVLSEWAPFIQYENI